MKKIHVLLKGIGISITKNLYCISCICLFFLLPVASFSQAKVSKPSLSIALNDTSVIINGRSFNANNMLADNLFRALGKPEQTDTLPASILKTIADYEMATLNKYVSKGILLTQGKKTERINECILFLNPDPSKKYLDYVNTGYTGKLSVLGFKIDSNVTIQQVQRAMSKYDFSLSEEYKNAELTVYDKKSGSRVLEVRFYLASSSEKIEQIDFTYYPNQLVKKHRMEYKDEALYLDNILLDTSANKTTQLKKILGAPNAVIGIDYRAADGNTYQATRYMYNEIRGISFVENPANNSLMSLQVNYLSLRKEHELGNPLIDLVLNKKPFNPEAAVPDGPDDVKSFYSFDSTSQYVDESDDKTDVTAYGENAYLRFEFAGKYNFEKRVYYFNYDFKYPSNPAETDDDPATRVPGLFIDDGMVWLQTKNKKRFWDNRTDASVIFSDIIGSPSGTHELVSEYADYGIRMWATEQHKVKEIKFFMTSLINPYSNEEEAPGIYTGLVQIEGEDITKDMMFDDVQQLLPMYDIENAYTNANQVCYKGKYKEVEVYFIFHKSTGKLASIAVDNIYD